MKIPGRRWLNALCLVLGLVTASPAWALEPRWPEGPYNYLVLDQDIHGVLEQFGRNMNVPVEVASDVAPQRVRGKIGGPSAKAFLQWLCDSYQLVWFFDGAVLHVSSQNAIGTAVIALRSVSADSVKQHLDDAGLLDERFPLTNAGQSAVRVVGPPAYTSLVAKIVMSLEGKGPNRRIADDPQGASDKQPPASPDRQNPADQPRAPAVITGIERAPSPAASAADTSGPASTSLKSDQQLSTTVDKSSRPNEAGDDENGAGNKGKVLVFRGGGTR